jgi:hypothetical protein
MNIYEQNCGLLLHKTPEAIVFDLFELSPTASSVITTKGRLRRYFPGTSISIPNETFKLADFRSSVTSTLATLMRQPVAEVQPRAKKAGQTHIELRDTVCPSMCTKLFASFLAVNGGFCPTRGVWKNTREEVMWDIGNKYPWTRSPTWLLLRVVLQLMLSRRLSNETLDCGLYKRFMIFHMSQVLHSALDDEFDSENIFVMNAKLARRVRKLNLAHGEAWMLPVQKLLTRATSFLNDRWQRAISLQKKALKLPCLVPSSIYNDTCIHLPKLDKFIKSISKRTSLELDTDFHPNSDLASLDKDCLPFIKSIESFADKYLPYNLATFESWVGANLNTWLESRMTNPDTCAQLRQSMQDYHVTAKNFYSNAPESKSVMFLTILELWIACDKSALDICPLLADYSPHVDLKLWQCLNLKSLDDMARLHRAEQYLHERDNAARHKTVDPLFSSFGTRMSFGVRYFASSQSHQQLKERIEEKADIERNDKCAELLRLQAECESLIHQSHAMPCEEEEVADEEGNLVSRHSDSCTACGLRQQARDKKIDVHEWPLPSDEFQANATVFEIALPRSFAEWRDCTLFFLKDVIEYEARPVHLLCYLRQYSALTDFASSQHTQPRLRVGSGALSHLKTHRRSLQVCKASESDVLLNNGLVWTYIDSEDACSPHPEKLKRDIGAMFMFPIHKSLQKFLQRSWISPNESTPNTLIAEQSLCPPFLSLEEFKAMCTIPSGHKLQWINLLTQLAMPTVDWTKLDSALLVWQVITQAGPSSTSMRRASHEILDDPRFVYQCLSNLKSALDRVRENWESCNSVGIYTIIATRLLSLAKLEAGPPILEFLRDCRQTCHKWLEDLRTRQICTKDTKEQGQVSARLLNIALICTQTFDIEEQHLKDLFADEETAMMFLNATILIQETAVSQSDRTSFQESLIHRLNRLLNRSCALLIRQIVDERNRCLHEALKLNWSAYRPASGQQWNLIKRCWLTTKLAVGGGASLLTVHYNLVTAEVLVNGVPLGRLPHEYQSHEGIVSLFGKTPLDVMPSTEPGFKFSSKKLYEGHEVHIALPASQASAKQNHDLLLRSRKDERTWELLPSRLFHSVFPTAFVDDFFHWYNQDQDVVEFRPKSTPWDHANVQWCLRREMSLWKLYRGNQHILINLSSSTSKQLGEIFQPIQDLPGLHIIFDTVSNMLNIEIPRLKLLFHIEAGNTCIASHQYRGMCVDENQSIGTLIGLKNKLILCKINSPESRMILIPEGTPVVSCERAFDSSVKVTMGPEARRVQAFRLDSYLGSLSGNGSLQSKLFLAELHALTSNFLPDPFTGHTGTEEALGILRSQGLRSFTHFEPSHLSILHRIQDFAPGRSYYPVYIRVMQVVKWRKDLPYLSQHGELNTEVKKLFEQAQQLSFLSPGCAPLPKLKDIDEHLMIRDMIRSSTFRIDEYGGCFHTTSHDMVYTSSRDAFQHDVRTLRTCHAVSALTSPDTVLPYSILPNATELAYKHLSSLDPNEITLQSFPELRFDASWLEIGSAQFLQRIHLHLRQKLINANKFDIMMWLGTLAYSKRQDKMVLSILIGIIRIPDARGVGIPSAEDYDLRKGTEATKDQIRNILEGHYISVNDIPETAVRTPWRRSKAHYTRLRRKNLRGFQAEWATIVTDAFYNQWPCEVPTQPGNCSEATTYVSLDTAMGPMTALFRTWMSNIAFKRYLESIFQVLRSAKIHLISAETPQQRPEPPSATIMKTLVTMSEVIGIADLQIPSRKCLPTLRMPRNVPPSEFKNASNKLEHFIEGVQAAANTSPEKRYVERLKESDALLKLQSEQTIIVPQDDNVMEELQRFRISAKQLYDETSDQLLQIFGGSRPQGSDTELSQMSSLTLVRCTHQWPRISVRTIVMQLARSRWQTLSTIRRVIVKEFAEIVSHLQAADRLLSLSNQPGDLSREVSNLQRNWDPLQQPEYLLLEVESNIRIRDVQYQIAKTMISPPSEANSVMQLNMGEGKSSLIVPIVAVALANASHLVRVIVAKPQSRQMLDMLVSKLGGLLNRRVYHMPFSRSLQLDSSKADILARLYNDCLENRGILLVQPENILSFQLMVVESAFRGDDLLMKSLWKTQIFFDKNSRDVVDESDENFNVKFELTYTMGNQCHVDFSPNRWTIIQEVLGLFVKCSREVKAYLPKSVEINACGRGNFPKTRLLDSLATQKVLNILSTHIIENGIGGFPSSRQTTTLRRILRNYIMSTNPDLSDVEILEQSDFWHVAKQAILLLRGLFAKGILAFVFGQKRWRVNYGLDTTRQPGTKLAVPYRAKDNPSLRSEFSHSDVVICFTCLSYYYGGLSNEEIFQSLAKLKLSNQAELEFQIWTKDIHDLPNAYRHLEGVNTSDTILCTQTIFPYLRNSKGAIDFYLSKVVFAKEMREFSHKLTSTGWDLGKLKVHPTTGFSGTNDSQHTLPIHMKQLSLTSQGHTNALVLSHILQSENSVTLLSKEGLPGACTGKQLVELVAAMNPETRVILDVGALIIELSNEEVARFWLDVLKDKKSVQAAVFCNDNDEITVLDKSGRVEPLQISPFADQLDVCVIFLDEAHTRGIDLRLPTHFRAAVTLGANLTKDQLVQTCMRMRKLGVGQSVNFCVPEEIETKIRVMQNHGSETAIGVADVLLWSVRETWTNLGRSMPLWAAQGRNFVRQSRLWLNAASANAGGCMSKEIASKLLEDEAQTLEQQYRPCPAEDSTDISSTNDEVLSRIAERYREFADPQVDSSNLMEEQERELAPEVEEERQNERPAPAKPLTHSIHTDVLKFVRTGVLDTSSPAFLWAPIVLANTTAGAAFETTKFPKGLLVTRDFSLTVAETEETKGCMDQYQRSVQWILTDVGTHGNVTTMIVISPFEANNLMEIICSSKSVVLHTFAPRQNQAFAPLDHLQLYTVPSTLPQLTYPRRLIIELKIFSGQLYFDSLQEYIETCEFLNLSWKPAEDGMAVGADGFIQPTTAEEIKERQSSGFSESPVLFLKALMTQIRHNCEAAEKTHMGKLLDGVLLTEDDFKDEM